MCAHVFGIFVEKIYPSSIFSLSWKENILVGGENTWILLTVYFLFFPPMTQPHSKKNFSFIFSPKFFIHFISPLNKHTLNISILYDILLDWILKQIQLSLAMILFNMFLSFLFESTCAKSDPIFSQPSHKSYCHLSPFYSSSLKLTVLFLYRSYC